MIYQIFDRENSPNPNKKITITQSAPRKMTARGGEEYSFAVALSTENGGEVTLGFSDLNSENGTIPAENFFCLNLGGRDYRGELFEKEIFAEPDNALLLWITVRIPENASGLYRGEITLICGDEQKPLPLEFEISGSVEEHGWGEPQKLTRLSWFNSDLAQDGGATAPYTAPVLEKRTVSILGRRITVTENGLPGALTTLFNKNIKVCDKESLVCGGFELKIDYADGSFETLGDFRVTENGITPYGDGFRFDSSSESENFTAIVSTAVEFDGFIDCSLALCPKKDLSISDITLSYALEKGFDGLMIGLGKEGGKCPEAHDFTWDEDKHQNSLWIGGINGGLRCEFRGEEFREPFVNIYYRHRKLRMPESFANPVNGKPTGGVTVRKDENGARVCAFSGKRELPAAHVLFFDFTVLMTPLKELDMNRRLRTRYFHGEDPDLETAQSLGATHVVIHHAGKANTYINYPFLTYDVLIPLVQRAHDRGMGAKIYYTVREHSDKTCETDVMMSLGDEIFPAPCGDQGSMLWNEKQLARFADRFGTNRIPGWLTDSDMSEISDGQSRICNYYIEGLKWVRDKVGIDGIYIDDMAYDRYTIRRARRILDADGRDKWDGDGCCGPRLIDLHTWNHYNEHAGYANCLCMYLPLLPYIDSVWIGEGFGHVAASPEYWLTEITPVPYGVPGELLTNDQVDFDARYRGMLFGVTIRPPWIRGNVGALWKFIREVKLWDKELTGFWNDEIPLKTGHDDIKASVFAGEDQTVVVMASWAKEDVTVTPTLSLDGFDLADAVIPQIDDFQDRSDWNGSITIEKNKGIILVIPHK